MEVVAEVVAEVEVEVEVDPLFLDGLDIHYCSSTQHFSYQQHMFRCKGMPKGIASY